VKDQVSSVPNDDQFNVISSLPQLRVGALHRETREELAKADAKATTLTSIVGLILGALLAGAIAGDFSPQQFSNRVEWLFWTGVGLALAAEIALCSAIFPRIESMESREALLYFGHVAQFETRERFRSALLNADTEFERLTDQVYVLSKTVVRKYGLIRLGLFLLAAGVLFCMTSPLLDHYLF
jgi:MFS family permease